MPAILSFRCKETEKLFCDFRSEKFGPIERQARRKLLLLANAKELRDLRIPAGNRLEALKGDRKGQHSIRVNERWRVCFVWKDDGVHNVEIVDYH